MWTEINSSAQLIMFPCIGVAKQQGMELAEINPSNPTIFETSQEDLNCMILMMTVIRLQYQPTHS